MSTFSLGRRGKIALAAFALASGTLFAEDIKTTDGHEYKKVEITRAEPDGIVVATDAGIEKIPFAKLSEDVRQKYGYDPKKAAAFQEAMAKAQELRGKQARAEAEAANRKRNAEAAAAAAAAPKVQSPTLPPLDLKPWGNTLLDNPYSGHGALSLNREDGGIPTVTVDQIVASSFTLKGKTVRLEIYPGNTRAMTEVAEGIIEVDFRGESSGGISVRVTREQAAWIDKLSPKITKSLYLTVTEPSRYSSSIKFQVEGNVIQSNHSALHPESSVAWDLRQ